MKKYILAFVLGITLVSTAFAARSLPQNMDMAILKSVNHPYVELTPEGFSWLKFLTVGWLDRAQSFETTPALRIRTDKNLFIVKGKLSQYAGRAIALRRNHQNKIEEIWILTPQEQAVFRERAEKAKQEQN